MATQITRILVPTDGSQFALKAAAFAGELGRGLGAKIVVVVVHRDDAIQEHAWGPGAFPAGTPGPAVTAQDIRAKVEAAARETEIAATLSAIGSQRSAPEVVQLWGHPGEQISAYAEKIGASLIVMGSHGRTGIKRVLLGSVSHAVVHEAHCPVTIVR